VEYLYREYGQVKVINLNKSTAPTFEDALKEKGVYGVLKYNKSYIIFAA